MVWYKTELPILVTAFCAVLMIFEYFIVVPPVVTNVALEVRNFSAILAAFAMGLGTAAMARLHINKVARKQDGWKNSVVLLAVLSGVILVGVIFGSKSEAFTWIYQKVLTTLNGTGFSLLAFFVASGAYRAFRVRNLESSVLMVCALILLFNSAPLGKVIWPGIAGIAGWILDFPNVGGYRGMILGVSIGVISMGLSIIIGRERGYFGRTAE
jgi:uncharacterized membrane protein YidH (DUF202 family)